ncbi:MAG: HAMP domain-containing sensor histidine kinase [Desulfurivibrionaceae bacterium]|nr:HAMP domain-containing sensor histidine kinase [Desulfurivibrionaceae bacterium]
MRIKLKIVLNLLLILAAAMLLIDLVMVGSARRQLLQARLETGHLFLAAIVPALYDGLPDSSLSGSQLESGMAEAATACLTFINGAGEDLFTGGPDCGRIGQLRDEAHLALSSGEATSSFAGVTRGIIWPDRKSLLIARPYLEDQKIVGALAADLDLGRVYQALRDSQRIFFVYFAVNLLVFTLFGFYQLYRLVLKPITRLVNTAEEFRDDDGFSFLPETTDGEFNRLSHSLNKMLARIGRDRGRLRETIADLEDANLMLRKTQLEMVRAEKLASVGRLSAGIAHEIGNPIGIVIGYLDLLKQNSIPAEQKKDFILRAEKEVNRVNTIIRQLLDFARQPADEPRGEVSLHRIIGEVVDICRIQPMMAGIELVLEENAGQDCVVGSSGQLKQVFLNLLINAADAIKEGAEGDRGPGRITVTTDNRQMAGRPGRGGVIRIRIADNGPGIAAGNLENIFDPFYTTKEPGKGTGLGLSICFTIIENMGGVIEAASGGEGTTITVSLPLC